MKKMKKNALQPRDIYPSHLPKALAELGTYVYAYYRPDKSPYQPFYIGKGQDSRGLIHWKVAFDQTRLSKKERAPLKEHEEVILDLLERGLHPEIKILAYDLDRSEEDRYSLVERVLLDAFGIQAVWKKQPGHDDVKVNSPAVLLQSRNESSRTPVMSLDAVLARGNFRGTVTRTELSELLGVPVLTVGLSKTYHSSYTPHLLSEMARRYWALQARYGNTKLARLLEDPDSVLLAWSSQLNGKPMVVGAWRILQNSMTPYKDSGREEFQVTVDNDLRKQCIGLQLDGTGNNWQGQHILLPETD